MQGLVDVLQIGLERERIAVAEHVEIPLACLRELEHLRTMLFVFFDAGPVGCVDLQLCGQVSAERRAVWSRVRFVPVPFHGWPQGGQISRIGKAG